MKLSIKSCGIHVRSDSIVYGFFCMICICGSGNSPGTAQTAVQRDQQALTLLTQTLAVSGGQNALRTVQDLTETGTVKFNWGDPVTATVTIKSRGLRQFRADATLPAGQRSTITNASGGLLIEADGAFRPISKQSASDLGSMTFPYLPLMAAIQDLSVSIVSVGLVDHDGASAYDVRIQKTYTATEDPRGNRGIREARDFYIDPNTFRVIAIADQLYLSAESTQGIPHEVLYSDYQSENGIAVPLTISETIRGITGATIQLSQVTFNSGLTDSDFRKQ